MTCSWEFAHLGMCGGLGFNQGPLTVFHIFLIAVVLVFPCIAAYQMGFIAGWRRAARQEEKHASQDQD